jgi:hypothetical protein
MIVSRKTWTALNLLVLLLAATFFLASAGRPKRPGRPLAIASTQTGGEDGRPGCQRRYEACDEGVVLEHGRGPGACDLLGARDVTVYAENGGVYLGYDGAGPEGWLACLASSTDLKSWQRHGPILRFGMAGERDRRYAGYPVIGKHEGRYYCYYVSAAEVTGFPCRCRPFRTRPMARGHRPSWAPGNRLRT